MEIESVKAVGDGQSGTAARPGVYNPVRVRVSDTVGSVFLGLLSVMLLVALLRSEARNRKLAARLSGEILRSEDAHADMGPTQDDR